jgi:hypothetical protein
VFKPQLHVLPPAQRRLWPALRSAADAGFVLYGGTAIGLRLGHRTSIDFDFFSDRPLDKQALQTRFEFMARATVVQDERETLSVLVPSPSPDATTVKVSFFGALAFGRVGVPEATDDGVLVAASLDDLMATKLKVILQRAEAKDYRDIAAMLGANVDLATGLAAARLLFAPTFQPSESLKALVYFGDGDLDTLPPEDKRTLVAGAGAVRELPAATRRSSSLGIRM